jgi:lambda family phage portal protein
MKPLRSRIMSAFRMLTRGYDAAGASGRWPMSATMVSTPRQALAARETLAKKAAYLIQNTPIGEAIAATWATHVWGDAPSVRSNHPNRAMRRALERAWAKFFKRADIEGGGIVSLGIRIVRTLVWDGECFIRFLATGRGELQLQLLPANQIDASITQELPDGGVIDHGIERGPNGEPRGYWVFPKSPDAAFGMVGVAVRIDAADMLHVFEPRFPGQIRGVSWLVAVMTRILELDATEDAAVMKAKVNALVAGFIRDLDGHATDDAVNAHLEWEPGTLRRLRTGEDITWSPTTDMEGLNGFLTHLARSVCAGAGVPFELVTGDLSQVNYSSARVGLQSFNRRVRAVRASVLIARFLQPTWERMVTLEILSGRLNAPDFERDPEAFNDVTFLFPEPASIDPYRESQADVIALNAGIRSREEIIASRGRDIRDVDQEFAADSFTPRASAGNVTSIKQVEHDEQGRVARIVERAAMGE